MTKNIILFQEELPNLEAGSDEADQVINLVTNPTIF